MPNKENVEEKATKRIKGVKFHPISVDIGSRV